MKTYWVLGEDPNRRAMRMNQKPLVTPLPSYTSIKSSITTTPRSSRHSSLGHHSHLQKISSTPVLSTGNHAIDTVASIKNNNNNIVTTVSSDTSNIANCAFSKLPLMVAIGDLMKEKNGLTTDGVRERSGSGDGNICITRSPKEERRRRNGCYSRRSSSVKLKFTDDELIPGSKRLRPSDFNSYDTIWERKDSDTSDPMEGEPLLTSASSAHAAVCLTSSSSRSSYIASSYDQRSSSRRHDILSELSMKSLEILPSATSAFKC